MRTLGFISLVAASGHHRTRPKEVRGPKPPYTPSGEKVLRIAERLTPLNGKLEKDGV